jgi:DNA repair protein RecO (recombination protein O)
MATERAEGIVLRTQPVTETSLLVTWFTREFGKLKTLAKGARRPKSPLRGQLDLFFTDEIVFFRSRRTDLHLLNEAYLEHSRRGIRQSVEQVAAAAVACEIVESLMAEEDPHPIVYGILGEILDEMAQRVNWAMLIWFELRVLRDCGWEAQFPEADGTSRVLRSLASASAAGARRIRLTAEQVRVAMGTVRSLRETAVGRELRSQRLLVAKLRR